MIFAFDRKVFPIDPCLKHAIHGTEAIVTVRLDVKSDEIRTEQTIQQFLLPRTDTEGFRVRPRNMPEDRNSGVRHPIFHHPRQKCEVVILNQDYRMFLARHFFHDCIGKSSIHMVVVFPVRGAKRRASMRHMAERPQTLIGKAVVISFLFFRAEPNATESISRIVGWNLQAVMTIHDLSVRIPASLCDPGSVASAKYRFNGCNQTASWHRDGDSGALPTVTVRFAIGDTKQTAAITLVAARGRTHSFV